MANAAVVGPRTAPDLQVMTYNIRLKLVRSMPRSPDRWSYRRGALRRLLLSEQPAVLGVQEAIFEQAAFLADSLGDHYRRIGRGRNENGRGEGCPLFFDASRLHLDGWRQLALSDTPDAPGSRTFGNFVPRVVVSARFTDRVTGERFRVLNTHLDLARRSRMRSAEMIAHLVADSDIPVIVMGDFNTSFDTEPHELLTAAGLVDTWSVAATHLTESWGTFPNYRAPRLDRKRIDWILATPDVEVRAAAINPRRPGGIAPSDHLPVQAVVRFGS